MMKKTLRAIGPAVMSLALSVGATGLVAQAVKRAATPYRYVLTPSYSFLLGPVLKSDWDWDQNPENISVRRSVRYATLLAKGSTESGLDLRDLFRAGYDAFVPDAFLGFGNELVLKGHYLRSREVLALVSHDVTGFPRVCREEELAAVLAKLGLPASDFQRIPTTPRVVVGANQLLSVSWYYYSTWMLASLAVTPVVMGALRRLIKGRRRKEPTTA